MFHFSTYCPSLLKHLSSLSANFWMPDAKNDGWLLLVPLKKDWLHLIIWHKFFITIYWMHLKLNLICIYFLTNKNTITTRCSLREDFSSSVAIFNAYKWRHSDVIVIKLLLRIKFPTKHIFRIFTILTTNRMTLFCNLFIKRPSY